MDRTPVRKGTTTDRSPRSSPYKGQYQPRGSGEPEWASPLRNPNNFKEDYGHPDQTTHQKFSWNQVGCEWRLWMARQQEAYAGVRFRRSLDLSGGAARRKRMIFQLSPRWMEQHLTLGLTGKDRKKQGVTLSKPLSEFRVGSREDWGYYAVGFYDFAQADAQTPTLDWEKIAGMKFSRFGESSETTWVTIRNVLFEQ